MNGVQKIMVLVVGVGMVTALTLPERQTARVLDALFGGFRGVLGTAISGRA